MSSVQGDFVFEMSRASDVFFWIYLREVISKGGKISSLNHISAYDWELSDHQGDSLIGWLRETTGVTTVRITANSKTTLEKFKEISNSISYVLAYHVRATFRFSSEIVRNQEGVSSLPGRINDVDNIQFPKLKYDSNLTNYYSKMISSSDVSSQFLSLYHILEHEFDKIITEDTIKYVSSHVGSTSFSHKDPTSVENLIKEVVKRVKFSQDDDESLTAGKEINALRLVISRYGVSKSNLSRILGRDLIKYYGEHDVQFCGAKKIDLSKDDDEVFADLAQRIYTVRNAIVHSKSKNSSRFVPFRDEAALSREIPLLQAISEQIIESSAVDLN